MNIILLQFLKLFLIKAENTFFNTSYIYFVQFRVRYKHGFIIIVLQLFNLNYCHRF